MTWTRTHTLPISRNRLMFLSSPPLHFIISYCFEPSIMWLCFLFSPLSFWIFWQVSQYTFALCSYREKKADPNEMMQLDGYTVTYTDPEPGQYVYCLSVFVDPSLWWYMRQLRTNGLPLCESMSEEQWANNIMQAHHLKRLLRSRTHRELDSQKWCNHALLWWWRRVKLSWNVGWVLRDPKSCFYLMFVLVLNALMYNLEHCKW